MTGRRAHSVDELKALTGMLFNEELLKNGKPLDIKPTDIVVTPFAKSGTTWLQQMVHTLRTGGDMDFDDISRVVPWIETSPLLGLDLNAEQLAEPRAFKSHLEYERLPQGGRYINSVRDPRDALYSHYKFMEGWFMEPNTVSIEDFAFNNYINEGRYWAHLSSWWKVRDQDNVLFLCYELMQQDIDTTINRVAKFIGVPLNEKLLEITREHTSIDFMKTHRDRFDDAMMRQLSEEQAGLPPGSDSSKVRSGIVGDHQEKLTPAILEALDEKWKMDIAPLTGCDNYNALIAKIASENPAT
jgi:hypothetical protein